MNVHQLEEEMKVTKQHLALLENQLKAFQEKCEHHFEGDQYFEKCSKCHKVEVLYY
ncbi:serine protease [Alkalihalobacillus sp. CinArs1]|uniref:serine protease n=1 Tax=Alkalihalobacillus sp. CinArs1 TaxID=2995314 RepID=UPI0022DE0968|nr:serine protease [Alkalihalobacillus sp. CinArs1]